MGFLTSLHPELREDETRAITLRDPVTGELFPTWGSMLGTGPTAAGVEVTEQNAEGIATVFACVRVIASAVAQLPLKLYQLATDGSKHEAVDDPLYAVLHDLANPEMTAFEFRYVMQSHLLLWGNAYASIERDRRGQVTALWPLLPWWMYLDRDDQRHLRYHYGGQVVINDPVRAPILRLHVHSLDGIRGRSVVRVLRESMGMAIALQQFGASFFAQGAQMGGVFSHPTTFAPGAKKVFEDSIKRQHTGLDRAHGVVIVEEGMKYDRIGIPPEDAQYLQTKKLSRSEIAGAFGVPPHMIGDLERATFSNVENESIRWLRDGLEERLVNWESAIGRDCLGPRAFPQRYARFVRQASVRGDLKTRSEALQIQRQNGIISANEWRTIEDMDPISAADGGDQYVITSQSRPNSGGDTTPPPPPTEPT